MSREVVVTGCSRGIGAALVARFIEMGISVAGCARSVSAVQELGSDPSFRTLDVTDDRAMRQWASDLESAGKVPDLVIANAGVLNEPAPLWEISADQFDLVVDVNVKGVANTARAFLPSMIASGGGVFVALSSGWGRSTSEGVAPYCASKFAVEGLVGSLSQDLPEGVVAVALSPGVVDTTMLARAFGPQQASQAVDPSSWAREAADFLLSIGPQHNGESLSFQR